MVECFRPVSPWEQISTLGASLEQSLVDLEKMELESLPAIGFSLAMKICFLCPIRGCSKG